MPVAEHAHGWLAAGLVAAARIRVDGVDDPPVQYVHLDDLADAVVLATDNPALDGPLNVAPDGWISGEQLRALAGGPRIRLPERVVRRIARIRATVPGLTPYATHPWVVANDRLRAAGWVPAHSNEEAFVAGHRAQYALGDDQPPSAARSSRSARSARRSSAPRSRRSRSFAGADGADVSARWATTSEARAAVKARRTSRGGRAWGMPRPCRFGTRAPQSVRPRRLWSLSLSLRH